MKSNNSIEVTLHQSYKHHHKCLRMTVNIHQIERLFFRINPKIKKYQDLKEEWVSKFFRGLKFRGHFRGLSKFQL